MRWHSLRKRKCALSSRTLDTLIKSQTVHTLLLSDLAQSWGRALLTQKNILEILSSHLPPPKWLIWLWCLWLSKNRLTQVLYELDRRAYLSKGSGSTFLLILPVSDWIKPAQHPGSYNRSLALVDKGSIGQPCKFTTSQSSVVMVIYS